MNGNVVTVVSTFTRDRLPTSPPVTVPGGPAHFIGQAFRALGQAHEIITGVEAFVDVLPGSGEHQYLIPPLPLIPMPARFSGPATIFSPIAQEIDPARVPPVDGLFVIDLQGFVREPGRSTGCVSSQFDLSALLLRANVVKASEEEVERLQPGSRQLLNSVDIVLVTHGSAGADLRWGSRERRIRAQHVANANTIGAGDSYLARFVSGLVRGEAPATAAEAATRFVEGLLRSGLNQSANSRL